MTAMVTGEALRTCRDCGLQAFTEADLDGFVKNATSKHGRGNRCRPCDNARCQGWQAKNADRAREYQRGYRSGAFKDRLVWDVRELSYLGIHRRLNVHFGKASEYACVHCNGPAREWAFTQDDEDVRYGVNGNGYVMAYSLKPEYYMPLCSGCHRAFDAKHKDNQEEA